MIPTALTKKSRMSVNRLRALCVEIFKTVNNISPPFMQAIFCLNNNGRTVREEHIKILIVRRKRTVTFGTNSLTVLGPKIWNSLPSHLKHDKSGTVKCLCKQCNSLL